MPDAMAEQIEAYQRLLPQIKQKYGSVWVLIAAGDLVATFKEFAGAAKYANEHLTDRQVLIRHTDRRPEFVPLIVTGPEPETR
jgi:hypothetical protein